MTAHQFDDIPARLVQGTLARKTHVSTVCYNVVRRKISVSSAHNCHSLV